MSWKAVCVCMHARVRAHVEFCMERPGKWSENAI